MLFSDLGARLRPGSLTFVSGKHPTLRAETEDGLPLLFVGGRTVVEVFAPSAICRLQGDLPVVAATRLRLAQVPRQQPAKAPWPTEADAFLAEALAALEHAAGARLGRALAAIRDLVRARLLEGGHLDALETGASIEIHAGGGTIEWIDARQRPARRQKLEIQEPRFPALCAGLRLPTGSGTLARVQTVQVPPVAPTAHERLRISDASHASATIDALLAEEKAAAALRGKRRPAGG